MPESGFGIICLTPGNLDAEWLHFEAGAMWKAYEQSRVCPFLVGIAAGPADVKPPLGLFQACDSTSDDEVFRMLKSINLSAPESDPLSDALLERSFKRWLPDLRERLSRIGANETVPAEHRAVERDARAAQLVEAAMPYPEPSLSQMASKAARR